LAILSLETKKAGQLVRPVVIRFIRLHQDVQKCGGPTQSLFGPRHEQNLSANPETNSEILIVTYIDQPARKTFTKKFIFFTP
jgi:hypothetical protein